MHATHLTFCMGIFVKGSSNPVDNGRDPCLYVASRYPAHIILHFAISYIALSCCVGPHVSRAIMDVVKTIWPTSETQAVQRDCHYFLGPVFPSSYHS